MTRPIYEPSPARTDAKLGFGNAQLFRRPAPSGSGSGVVAFAYMGMILNQDDPFPTDTDDTPTHYGTWNEGFTSDENILYPDLTNGIIYLGTEGSYPGDINFSSPGYYVASTTVAGWDNWTGPGTQVLDAIKGCGMVWDGRIDNRDESVILQPASGLAGVPDSQSIATDSAIVGPSTNEGRIYPIVAQYSGVDAAWTQVEMFVCLITPYLYDPDPPFPTAVGTTSPTWGKWYP